MDENKITYYPTLCEVSIRAAITQIENIIYYSSNKDLDNPSNPYEKQLIEYNKFVIVETESQDRFQGTYTMRCSYSITDKENIYSPITYEQLKSFFSVKNLSALTKSKIRQTLANNHEIIINTIINELPIPSRLIEFLKNV